MSSSPRTKGIASALCLFVLLCGTAPNVIAKGQTYTARSEEEVEVLSLVIASEIKENNWAKSELICFSVDGLEPSPALAKSIRKRLSNVRSAAEWPKKFNCGYELQLEYTQFDLSHIIRIRSKVVDLRDINKGEGDLAILRKESEYTLQKIEGKWSIKDFVAKPLR